jgi:polygalacturonase
MKSRTVLLITAIWLGCLPSAWAILQWPLTVTNIAELKSLSVAYCQSAETTSTLSTSPAVYVLGYYTPDDRGGGMFEWDSNASATPDSGRYVATNGWSSGNGRWVRRLNGEAANIKMWGAKSDGVTECSAQIQHAVDACQDGASLANWFSQLDHT